MRAIVLGAAALLLAVSGCADGARVTSEASAAAAPRLPSARVSPLPPPGYQGPTCDGGPRIAIAQEPDYPDWVRVRGQLLFLGDKAPTGTQLGPVLLRVRCALGFSGTSMDYEPRDGDATFLPAGTPLYSVPGRPSVVATSTEDGIEIWAPE